MEIEAGVSKLVYDLGMNNGDDTAYYLHKGLKVVGIDANPSMCERCKERFKNEINDGRLIVLNIGVSEYTGKSEFYINGREPEISTFFPRKFNDDAHEWRSESIEVRPFSSLVSSFGYPHFVKIDVEFCDKYVLRDMLMNDIRPKFVSAECHEIDVYRLLVAMGYEEFNLVPGATVHERFNSAQVHHMDGSQRHFSFRPLASGPFGDDLREGWTDKNAVLSRILDHGLGWIDLHSRRQGE